MSEYRGRVRKAPPIDVTSYDQPPRTEFVPGGWIAEVMRCDDRVVDLAVAGTWSDALAQCCQMIRWFDHYSDVRATW